MKIIIEPYNPNWANQFEKESELISQVLKDHSPIIEHIGSTSVKGLGAKPIIDILIGFPNFDTSKDAIKKIEKLGYTYVQEYEKEMPFRRFFFKTKNHQRTHHIHLVQIDSTFWKRHLAFRNHLRENQKDREEYYKLKQELSLKDWKNGDEYASAKNSFIRGIEKKLLTQL